MRKKWSQETIAPLTLIYSLMKYLLSIFCPSETVTSTADIIVRKIDLFSDLNRMTIYGENSHKKKTVIQVNISLMFFRSAVEEIEDIMRELPVGLSVAYLLGDGRFSLQSFTLFGPSAYPV